jgi:hypothetical protein
MDERTKAERLAQARLEIAARIKRVCERLPRAEFERLLDRMAGIHCKHDVFPNIPEPPDSEEETRAKHNSPRT